jgi:hypothetical protein
MLRDRHPRFVMLRSVRSTASRSTEMPHVPQHQDAPQFEPPATDDEVRGGGAAIRAQAVRHDAPVESQREAFERAVDEVTHAARHLLASLRTAPAAGPRH